MSHPFESSTGEYTTRQMCDMQLIRIEELSRKNMEYKKNFDRLMEIAIMMRGTYLITGIKDEMMDKECQKLIDFIDEKE